MTQEKTIERPDKIREECGIFGVKLDTDEAAGITYNALCALQHRGQEGAGIAVLRSGTILYHKNIGLVSEVFNSAVLSKLPQAKIAIGHVRYSTTGTNSKQNTQPMVTEYLTGRLATAHNGNIVNAGEIKERLVARGCAFSATNDSEVVSSLIAYETLETDTMEDAVAKAAVQLKGAFSLVILSSQNKLIAIRDGWGFRPLCIGKNAHGWAVASESCALDSAGFEFVRDVKPGEMVIFGGGEPESRMVLHQEKQGLCIFEYIYFARTDSVIDNLSVYQARFNMGVKLAEEYPNVEGKRIVLVDDSIVRGTTSAKTIRSLKMAGAKEVHFLISSPPFTHTCHFGTDIDSEENLIANHKTIPEIRDFIGADSLGYISIEGVKEACSACDLPFCTGCFSGDYPVQIGHHTKAQFEGGPKEK